MATAADESMGKPDVAMVLQAVRGVGVAGDRQQQEDFLEPGALSKRAATELSLSTYARPGIEVRQMPGAGRSMYATRPFAAGDVILLEDAVAILKPGANKMERLLAFARSNGTARALTLDMYMPGMDVAEETAKKHVQDSLALAEQFLAEHSEGELACGFHVEELAAVNLAWIFNGFRYNGKGNEGSSALFAVASKLNHSCRPNVAYQSYGVVGGKAMWVAKRDIASGEELCLSYIDMESGASGGFWSVAARRRALMESKLFLCGCPSCVSYSEGDVKRCLPCRACKSGFLAYHIAGDAAVLEGCPWTCDACGTSVADDDHSLFGEEEGLVGSFGGERVEGRAERKVQELERWWGDLSRREKEGMWSTGRWWREKMCAKAMIDAAIVSLTREVGPRHWSAHKARYLLAQASIEGISFATATAINGRMTCDMLISTTDSLLPALFENVASMEAWLALDKEGIDSGLMLKILYESAAACLREIISFKGSFGSVFENGKHYPVACEIDFGQCADHAERMEVECKRVCPLPIAALTAEAA